jgi:tetratricopeptide (TPR) repeat protein
MKKGPIYLFICAFFLSAAAFSHAASRQETLAKAFETGNSEYQKGHYGPAEQYYRRLVDSGVNSGTVYYNLGNACFKQKKLGEAIYYWEKARQIEPADRDIRENLELASLMIVDRIETGPDPLPERVLSTIVDFLTIQQESWIVFALFVAANLFFSIYMLAKNSRNSFRALIASLSLGFVFVVFACSLSWKVYERDYRKDGIVVEQKVDVRSGPGPDNVAVFTIHEGIKVRVLGSAAGWYQISLPNGWNGWLQQNSLRIL